MNGIYCYLALKEIEDKLINRFIRGIGIKERLIQIEFDESALFISFYPEALGFYLNKRLEGFERLSYFDEHIANAKIVGIEQIDYAPVIDLFLARIEYGQKKSFKVRLYFYKEAPNLLFISEETRKHLFPKYVEKKLKSSIIDLTEERLSDKESIIKNFEGIDKFLVQELDIKNLNKLKTIIRGEPHKPRIVSITPLNISLFAQQFIREYDCWNDVLKDGINAFIEHKEKILAERRRKNQIKKIEQKIEKLKKDLADDEAIESYRISGELILMNISKIKKGMAKVILFNPYTQKEQEIKLDPMKDAHKNAEDYFKKYKKLKRGIPKIQEMIKKLEKTLELLKSGTETKKQISKKPFAQKMKEKKSLPFREFILDSGAHVYVGKDAHSNMELTFKFARPDDYFFHIRGYEGAHTILRPVLKKGQNVSREDIKKAAAIAAYFSKARNQKNVPVSYTQRKYLKKSRKAKLGTVILIREEVIFVDPGLPSDAQE